MAETANIAAMAEILANKVFAEFFWSKIGPVNVNWPCEDEGRHKVKTHPSDVVFFYEEPYADSRTYLNCDLKSYAKGSITSASIRAAIVSLANQVACAEISARWQELYATSDRTHTVSGLLFVYNHDGEYDKDFRSLLNGVKISDLELPPKSRIFVLGPEDIHWLDNVRHEIQNLRGSEGTEQIPPRDKCSYLYPELVRQANVQSGVARAATMEMLTSPWIIMRHPDRPLRSSDRYLVFVRRPPTQPEEVMYLLDHLRHYQLLQEAGTVTIKVLAKDASSHVAFDKGVNQYIGRMLAGNADSPLAKILKSIRFAPMTHIVTSFSDIQLGMENG